MVKKDVVYESLLSDKYVNIYNELYKEGAKKKYRELIKSLTVFSENIDYLSEDLESNICSSKASHAVYSYYMDIIRYKDFHFKSQEKKINKYKIAAFSTKWLLKTQPINLTHPKNFSPTDKDNFSINLINEQFCLSHIFDILDIDSNTIKDTVKDDLLYQFHFRNFDETWLFLLLESIDTLNNES